MIFQVCYFVFVLVWFFLLSVKCNLVGFHLFFCLVVYGLRKKHPGVKNCPKNQSTKWKNNKKDLITCPKHSFSRPNVIYNSTPKSRKVKVVAVPFHILSPWWQTFHSTILWKHQHWLKQDIPLHICTYYSLFLRNFPFRLKLCFAICRDQEC